MNLFEDLSKDWKQNKGWPSDFNKISFQEKNKTIMENLILLEKKEKNELKLAFFFGGLGVLLMIAIGIVFPVMKGYIALNPFIIAGATIVTAALAIFLWSAKKVGFSIDGSKVSKSYLLDAKKKIQSLNSNKSKLGITYIILLIAGITILNYGIFSQFDELQNFLLYILPLGMACGLAGFIIWRVKYYKKTDKEIKPLIADIDEMLRDL